MAYLKVISKVYDMKKSAFLLGLVLLSSSCGQKSMIKSHVEARALGDGEFITFPVVVPLSDKAISSFKSPIGDMNPLFRGFASSIMNLGASMGAGKTRLTLTQPIPEIPDAYLASIKIKRIFFFIEGNDKKESFEFLRKLAVKVSPRTIEKDYPSWEPIVETDSFNDNELSYFSSLFRSKRDRHAQNWEKNSPGLLLIKYNEDQREASFLGEEVGAINIIQTEKPNATRKYLEDNYGAYFTRIHTLNKSILIEFKKNPVHEEMFKARLSADALKVEELGIGEINPCSNNVCMDLKVPDTNLIPMLKKGNALKIDSYIDPKYAPKSFQLKGFLEFELKIKAKI
jgi:hypothetical protein